MMVLLCSPSGRSTIRLSATGASGRAAAGDGALEQTRASRSLTHDKQSRVYSTREVPQRSRPPRPRGRAAPRSGSHGQRPPPCCAGSSASSQAAGFRASDGSCRRCAPGRGSSYSPSSRSRTNRSRHLSIVPRKTTSRSAIIPLCPPSAAANTMRARNASACPVERRRASETFKARMDFPSGHFCSEEGS